MNKDTVTAASAARYQPASHYVDDAFYDWLNEVSLDLDAVTTQRTGRPEAALAAEIERLLTVESRLLDQHAYTEWLELYTPECAYWIPANRPAGDPRAQITLEFEASMVYRQLAIEMEIRDLPGMAAWLRHQADDLRHRRREDALLQAQALPVKLVFPLVICFLPGIFLSTLAPVLYQMIQVAGGVLAGSGR